MKRKFFVIMLILFVITLISIYAVYSYRNSIKSSQKINDEYNSYYNKQMLGNELISIINKTIDKAQVTVPSDEEKNFVSGYYANREKVYVYVENDVVYAKYSGIIADN